MNVLLLSARFPWPTYTGDRLRATTWLAALEREADVTLVAPRGEVPANAPRFHFQPAARSLARGAAGALRVLGGLPANTLLAAPYDWAGAIARARADAGDFEASIVLLSRLDPWVRPHLPGTLHILDAIDSLGRSLRERAREAPPLARWFWRAEAERTMRLESELANAYDRVVTVSADDALTFGRNTAAISVGAAIAPLVDAPRPFDFGFWGRLPYFANADAVSWLLDEIWPAIRALRSDATLVIGGAEAPARVRAAHGREGVTVQSPVRDIAALARSVKVALFPVRYGSGQANKVLEAAEGGAAIVATSKAMRGLAALAEHSVIADNAHVLAKAAVALLTDDARRVARSSAVRAVVERDHARSDVLAQLASIVRRSKVAA